MSVYSDTELANWALSILGGGYGETQQLEDIDGPDITSTWCRKLLLQAKELVWSDWEWNSFVKYVLGTTAGADIEGVQHPGYDYAYQLPADALLLLGLFDEAGNAVEYALANGYLHTNYRTDQFHLKYVTATTPTVGLGPKLWQCLAYRLAILLTGALLASNEGWTRRRALLQEYNEVILPEARAENQRQQYDRTNAEADVPWCDIR